MSNIGKQRLLFVLAAVLLIAGCRNEPPRPEPPPDGPSPFPELGIACSNYPAVDGSTSTQPLGIFVACKILDAAYTWVLWESDDSHRLYATDEFLYSQDPRYAGEKRQLCDWINSVVRHQGTHGAYVALIEGEADLILVARGPSEDERRTARKRQVDLDVQPVALDAFVILLNKENPVDTLTIEQIRGIYTGRILRWRDVGGSDARINPYQRNRNSGSQELMQKLVMKDLQMPPVPDMMVGTSMAAPFTMLDNDPHGVGYTVYFYHEHMAPEASVKDCAIDGVMPGPKTIRDGEYPLVTEVYVAIRTNLPGDAPARRLRDWLLSPAGQAIVEECGYVPIGQTAPPVELPGRTDVPDRPDE